MLEGNYVLVLPPGPKPRSHPFHCTKVLLALAVAIVVIFVLGGLLVFQKLACQGVPDHEVTISNTNITNKTNKTNKANFSNKTYHLQERNDKGQYIIFTAATTATYLIYGEVRCVEHTKDKIYLKKSWMDDEKDITSKEANYSHAFFLEKAELFQNSKVYLLFNEGEPKCNATVFHAIGIPH